MGSWGSGPGNLSACVSDGIPAHTCARPLPSWVFCFIFVTRVRVPVHRNNYVARSRCSDITCIYSGDLERNVDDSTYWQATSFPQGSLCCASRRPACLLCNNVHAKRSATDVLFKSLG